MIAKILRLQAVFAGGFFAGCGYIGFLAGFGLIVP